MVNTIDKVPMTLLFEGPFAVHRVLGSLAPRHSPMRGGGP